jgi:hypothetical protein
MAEMIDNESGQQQSGLKKIQDSLNNVNVQDMVSKARDYAQSNPAKVLGGLSALVIGAGLLANRGRR